MTSITDLVNQIERDHLIPLSRPEYDSVDGAISSSATSLGLTNTDVLPTQSIVNTGFELLYVTAWNRNSRQATVVRGHLGSTASAISDGQTVRINPLFPDVTIMDAMLDELASWDERVYKVESETLTIGAYDTTVEITPSATPYRILEARRRSRYDYEPAAYGNLRMNIIEPIALYPSGFSARIPQSYGIDTTVDVFYAVPFTTAGITATTDLEATTGLDRQMLEILKWGALWRLLAGRETARLDQTTHHRMDLDQAVPVGSNYQISERYKLLRDLQYNEAAKRLLGRWPYTFAG